MHQTYAYLSCYAYKCYVYRPSNLDMLTIGRSRPTVGLTVRNTVTMETNLYSSFGM